jgi:hypothetical protein
MVASLKQTRVEYDGTNGRPLLGSRLAQSQDGDMLGFFVSLFVVATAEDCEKVSTLMRIRMEFHGKDSRFFLGSQIGKKPRWRYTLLLLFLFDVAATEGCRRFRVEGG